MKNFRIQLLLVFILFFSCLSFGQNVTLTSLLLNDQTIVSGTAPIDIGTTNSITKITLNVGVLLQNIPSDNNPGTLKIYYCRNSSYSPIVSNGGDGGSLLFLGGTFASQTFIIQLTNAQFDNTGGFFYAEYKTYSGIAYKSSNVSIIKTVPGTGSVPIGNPSTASKYVQQVPYGGIPILPQLQESYDYIDVYWVNSDNWLPYDMYRNGVRTTATMGMTLYQMSHFLPVNGQTGAFNQNNPIHIYVTRPLGNIKRLYINNTIQKDQYITLGGTPEEITGDQGSYMNESAQILLSNYKWQKRIVRPAPLYIEYPIYMDNYGWKDIPFATQQNFTPSTNAVEVTEYRRLVLTNPTASPSSQSFASSNVVTIYPMSVDSNVINTICCNESSYPGVAINPIIGSTVSSRDYNYQWQEGIMSGSIITWHDIANTNTTDYIPLRPADNRGQTRSSVKYYRRNLIKKTDNKYFISNNVTVTFYTSSTGKPGAQDEIPANVDGQPMLNDESIIIFPNPSSSIINIDYDNASSLNIRVVDLTGKVIISQQPNQSNINAVQLNISELPTGVYSLILENDQKKIIKRIIKE